MCYIDIFTNASGKRRGGGLPQSILPMKRMTICLNFADVKSNNEQFCLHKI